MTKFEEVSRSLHRCLGFLSRWGYTPCTDEVGHSALHGHQLVVQYQSTVADRELRIHFSLATTTHAECFSVFVGTRDGQAFFVNDYLAQRSGCDAAPPLVNSTPEQTTSAFCCAVATCLQREFETRLADLLQGSTWNFAPFDWVSYK
ncbi:hypothetical protein PY254_16495 [Rhodanobacter sp. AS-Z3]|uniref:hypothetical protein n=1 Tax=Rhodanobacter sp. AS-Z3 TaxID=3031330 RepID=UPI002479A33F|nr:hypothetical protein [Rhodanobacter sp. AS-Z3]WEN14810.1 hypothetical protein PY254_16495 [Rhodanobacter sp. AS-Z3]